MKKYLIRGGRLPFTDVEPIRYATENLFGGNVGNYLYRDGVMRVLMLDDEVEFTSLGYGWCFTPEEIDRFNEEYDAFLIPLADAFRPSFRQEFAKLTQLIKQLKIPCHVIGAGCNDGFYRYMQEGNVEACQEAKAFVEAVLEKSPCLGLRGETTGEVLKWLGFREGTDYRVIGCPSLYMYGPEIKIRDTAIHTDSRVSYSANILADRVTLEKMAEFCKAFSDITFIPQRRYEYRTYFLGGPYEKKPAHTDIYPCDIHHPLYAENQVKFFYHTSQWVDHYRDVDFAFGTRFHGNVAAVLGGAPSILITKDVRMSELADFHQLCHVNCEELAQYRDVWELMRGVDFHRPEKVAKQNFENYLDFLHGLGLETIFDKDPKEPAEPCAYDLAIEKANLKPTPPSYVACGDKERKRRQGRLEAITKEKQRDVDKRRRKKKTQERKRRIKKKLKGFLGMS